MPSSSIKNGTSMAIFIQQRNLHRFAGSYHFVFNKTLALQKERYEQGEKKLNYFGLGKLPTEWRNGPEIPWLKDTPAHPFFPRLPA